MLLSKWIQRNEAGSVLAGEKYPTRNTVVCMHVYTYFLGFTHTFKLLEDSRY